MNYDVVEQSLQELIRDTIRPYILRSQNLAVGVHGNEPDTGEGILFWFKSFVIKKGHRFCNVLL